MLHFPEKIPVHNVVTLDCCRVPERAIKFLRNCKSSVIFLIRTCPRRRVPTRRGFYSAGRAAKQIAPEQIAKTVRPVKCLDRLSCTRI